MCGVIGIIKEEGSVAEELLLGLNSIQHRGQDACGMITTCGNEHSVIRQKGTVSDLTNKIDLSRFKGEMGICHTRYPTAGSIRNSETQPFQINSTQKIAMAHNGNVTNYSELQQRLKDHGVFLSSTVDLEPVIKIFAYEFEKCGNFFESVETILTKVKGAYSFVGSIGEVGIFGFRDPAGIRPLMMGKNDGGYIFASESVVLDTLGYEYVKDLEPGEAVIVRRNNGKLEVESNVVNQKIAAHCMFEWIYFARPDSVIEETAIYKARFELGKVIAKRLSKENIDVVIPVPDTARPSAIGIAEVLKVKYSEGIIKNRYIGRTFIMASQKLREKSVAIKLNPIASEIKDKTVVVVDDSIVRGTTSKRIVETLKKAKPKKIIFVSICPPIKHPCFYGIDFPTRDELIASNKSVEEICEYIGADKLYYGKVKDVEDVIGKPLCCACLTGNYPTDIDEDQKSFMEADSKCYRKR